ncbi:MAG: S-adenosylmethionine:tRNA ribosyltransferase-isomerase [Cyclobacteriaceae bacterium]
MKAIRTEDFFYNLPEDRIAQFPLPERDQSKLLVFKGGKIQHRQFFELPDLLPHNSCLFFNDTKVIPARIKFVKETGAAIEVFLLNPADTKMPLAMAMQARESAEWECMIGNLKRWTKGTTLAIVHNEVTLKANLVDQSKGLVRFEWTPVTLSFAEVVSLTGTTPLPPYLNRQVEASDSNRYQTVYSRFEGAVAAPTAGLHFTEEVMAGLKKKSVGVDFLTLHVSAGTFAPIKSKNALEHSMHSEQVMVNRSTLENLVSTNRSIIAVGTTAVRTLESLYWYGVKLLDGRSHDFVIAQDEPYQYNLETLPSTLEALAAVLNKLAGDQLVGTTSIYIVPGYQFRVCDGLITNFHQPGSTLMLLVAAFVGDRWKDIYDVALTNHYRFLSYGDSSLLLPS